MKVIKQLKAAYREWLTALDRNTRAFEELIRVGRSLEGTINPSGTLDLSGVLKTLENGIAKRVDDELVAFVKQLNEAKHNHWKASAEDLAEVHTLKRGK